jgi:hypothetical protein
VPLRVNEEQPAAICDHDSVKKLATNAPSESSPVSSTTPRPAIPDTKADRPELLCTAVQTAGRTEASLARTEGALADAFMLE